MTIKRTVSIAVIICVMFAATGCSSGGSAKSQTTKKISGTVKENISDGGEVERADRSSVTARSSEELPADSGSGDVTYQGFRFIPDCVTVTLDADINTVSGKLGETVSYYESVSCAFNGIDKIYTYQHFEIQTYPNADGIDRISVIVLFDDLYETEEGITIGSSAEEVEAAYPGCLEKGVNRLTAVKGQDSIMFILDSQEKVISVQYISHVLDGKQEQ